MIRQNTQNQSNNSHNIVKTNNQRVFQKDKTLKTDKKQHKTHNKGEKKTKTKKDKNK